MYRRPKTVNIEITAGNKRFTDLCHLYALDCTNKELFTVYNHILTSAKVKVPPVFKTVSSIVFKLSCLQCMTHKSCMSLITLTASHVQDRPVITTSRYFNFTQSTTADGLF